MKRAVTESALRRRIPRKLRRDRDGYYITGWVDGSLLLRRVRDLHSLQALARELACLRLWERLEVT